MDASPQLSAASLRALLASASTTLAWMTDPHTQQFTYTARDADAAHAGLAGGSSNLSLLAPLRALATAAAAGALVAAGVTPSARVAQTLLDATAATLRAIAAAAVANSSDGAAFLSARAMGECSVSTIAHSGMFILALARAPPDVAAPFLSLVEPLAEGVARQQRSDGTFQIYFEQVLEGGAGVELHQDDRGWELYGFEATLGLALASLAVREEASSARFASCAMQALLAYRRRFLAGEVNPTHAIFFFNWAAQAARAVAAALALRDAEASAAALCFGLEMSDCLAALKGPLRSAEHSAMRVATVEVSCALEGLADALTMAMQVGDASRCALYLRAAECGVNYLLRCGAAARDAAAEGRCPAGAAGGFGAALAAPWEQRCDTTAHAVTAMLKLLAVAVDVAEEEEQQQGEKEEGRV